MIKYLITVLVFPIALFVLNGYVMPNPLDDMSTSVILAAFIHSFVSYFRNDCKK